MSSTEYRLQTADANTITCGDRRMTSRHGGQAPEVDGIRANQLQFDCTENI